MALKDLGKGKVIVKLGRDDHKQFLLQAKSEGFRWSISKEILEADDCTSLVLVDLGLKIISNVSSMRYAQDRELQDLPMHFYEPAKGCCKE